MKDRRLLIVEDEKVTVDLLKQLLVGADYQYDFVENQSEALRKIEEWRPDVLLLDLRIPREPQSAVTDKKNGIQLARDANSMMCRLKIIVVTGDTDWRLQEILAEEDYIYRGFTKGRVSFDRLQGVIEEALSTSG